MKDLLGYEMVERVIKKDDFNFDEIVFPKVPDERNELLLAAFTINYGAKYLNLPSDEAIMVDCHSFNEGLMWFARTTFLRFTKNIDGCVYEFVGATLDNKDKVFVIFKNKNKYVIEVMPLIRYGYKMEQFPLYYFYEKQAAYDYVAMILDENS